MIDWRNIEGLADALAEAGLNCYQLDGKWVAEPDAKTVQAFIDAYEPPAHIRKLIGVEFESVMCSATSADQSGLTAVFILIQMQGASFQPTAFEFENGNVLVIHLGNWQAFAEVWTAFRQSFFKVTK